MRSYINWPLREVSDGNANEPNCEARGCELHGGGNPGENDTSISSDRRVSPRPPRSTWAPRMRRGERHIKGLPKVRAINYYET